jgi:S-adenosylmethionine synthetase
MVQNPDTRILVSAAAGAHPDLRSVEMVERKGRGHPDTICDALAEAFTISLSRAYHQACGAILHHNVDKVLLVGASAPRFGGGTVNTPFDVYLAGRATHEVNGVAMAVCHVGKSYSIVANQIAGDLVAKLPDVLGATCILVSRIGWPIDTPQAAELQLHTRNGVPVDTLHAPAAAIACERLRGLTTLPRLLLETASVESPATWPGVLLF